MLLKICTIAEKLFMRYGIRSITMDDVARELSISKKTLYQFVEDKDDLVKKTISIHLEEIDRMALSIVSNEDNAIQQILKIADIMISMHKEVSQGLLFDLKKFHPDSFTMLIEHREKVMVGEITKNLHLGIKQKLYRKDLNVDLTAGFYMALVMASLDSDISILNRTPFNEKYAYFINYHLTAICTDEGHAYLHKHKKNLTKPSLIQ